MDSPDLTGAEFRKASSCAMAMCVRVATNVTGVVAVRDGKNPSGPVLTFTPSEWTAFVTGVRNGEFEV
ncbi:DUF397 domain-containing protein [Rhizohabitans arisaemae]|uniref:DUF397 domain-containing protein n=1 Tax=Rhizohabitans arisaemae TaxID=2720610 RepID=UPI0024B1513D|nr:DUF397 domain-containing protein [Rhizohabitans arisaemae]